MRKTFIYAAIFAAIFSLASCQDDEVKTENQGGNDEDTELPDWYYTGGKMGTTSVTTQTAFEQPTLVVDESVTMTSAFNRGEQLFEKPFNSNNSGTRHGLGPVYIRTSCQHCHPGYGHGQSQPTGSFRTNDIGNGYLLVVYDPSTNAYSCLQPCNQCLRFLACRYAADPCRSPFQGSAGRKPNYADLA